MAYNKANKIEQYRRILEVYNKVKQTDIPDTQIIRHTFPKYGIFISYRTFVTIKGMKPSELKSKQTKKG